MAAPAAEPKLEEEPESCSKKTGGGEGAGDGKPSAGSSVGKLSVAAGSTVPEMCVGGGRRVMHPAVLGAATLMVAGVVLGVGVALVSGHLA